MVLHMVYLSVQGNSREWFSSSVSEPQGFFKKLIEKVTDPQKEMLSKAIERQKKIAELVRFVNERRKASPEQTDIKKEAELLKTIVDFETEHPSSVAPVEHRHLEHHPRRLHSAY
jgi:hypothetical protein